MASEEERLAREAAEVQRQIYDLGEIERDAEHLRQWVRWPLSWALAWVARAARADREALMQDRAEIDAERRALARLAEREG